MLGAWKPKQDLPLYKDKPNNHSQSKKASRIVMLFKGFIASLVCYFIFYYFNSTSVTAPSTWAGKQQKVKEVFLELWHSYEQDAWGYDVYHPVTRRGENMGPKPLGWMIVDALDTLMIMDCPEETARAREWIKDDLDYKFDYPVNVFETTIRMLGGLLSAHHWSKGDDMYLDKAVDLAQSLLGAFQSSLGLPFSSVNLDTGKGIPNHVDGGASSTAEVSTIQLEFKYLAKLTGENLYWEKVEKVMKVLDDNHPAAGLAPIYVNPNTGKYQGKLIRLGLRGDSYYEYLLKQYLQTDEEIYWDMYRESVRGVKGNLIGRTQPSQLTFIGELDEGVGHGLLSKMDHLVCFYGGLLALGATKGVSIAEAKKTGKWHADLDSDMKLAEELTETCYRMYHDVPATGLSPEIVVFNQRQTVDHDFEIKPRDRHNLQRPETVESLFVLYRITGDEKYRQWGWEIFENFVKHTKVVGKDGRVSYSTLDDVTTNPPKMADNMELFWLAETLKYLYLLFDDDNKVPLDKYVFNTEAHPFPVFDMGSLFKTGWRRSTQSVKKSNNDDKKNENKKEANSESNLKELEKESKGTGEKIIPPPPPNVDKKHPPKAAPANKKVDEEAVEVVKEAS